MICDEFGNIIDPRVATTYRKIAKLTEKLYTQLFEEGMTQVEGRALIVMLEGAVTCAAIMKLLTQSCKHETKQKRVHRRRN